MLLLPAQSILAEYERAPSNYDTSIFILIFKAIFWGPIGHDFSFKGGTELFEPFLAKKIHRGAHRAPENLKNHIFQLLKFLKNSIFGLQPPKKYKY